MPRSTASSKISASPAGATSPHHWARAAQSWPSTTTRHSRHPTSSPAPPRGSTPPPGLGAIGFRILTADGVALDRTSWGYPKSLLPRAASRFAATTFVGCGHALARRCFDPLGGYDDSLFFAWEEYEFARRAIAAGWRIEHHGDLAVIHAVSPEARVTWVGGRWRHFVRNRLLIAHDWHGPVGMIPRAALYAARGLAAGRLAETLGAIAEARRIARSRPRRQADAAARRYIHARETAYRLPGPIRFSSADASAVATVPPMAAPPAPSGRS